VSHRALEIVSLVVTNSDGTAPWSSGQPVVRAVMRNTTGHFLNYPGVHLGVSIPGLEPTFKRNFLYGIDGCGDAEMEMGMGFTDTVPSGTEITFTAHPAYINGDECPLSSPPVSVTATAR